MQVGSSSRATTYVSSTQLTFQLTVADQANVATLYITVVNSPPGGGNSTALLNVAAATATPVISSVTPTQFIVGSSGSFLEVQGTGLTANSVVEWNGTPLAGSFLISPGYLYASIPTSLLTAAGSASITVNSPTATPSLSNALPVSIINPPVPTLTSVSPSFGPIKTAFKATLTGSSFTINSKVSVNGVAIPTTFVTSTQLTAAVPANEVGPGNNNFICHDAGSGWRQFRCDRYTAYIPIANNSMVYNPVNQLFYLSIPSSAGAPYANSVVSLDPVTGALGTPIFVGSEPNRLALTSDGNSLWVGLDGASAVRKVDLVAKTAGLQFSLPTSSSYTAPLKALAIAAVPGQSDSVVVSAANQSFNVHLTSSTTVGFHGAALSH